MANDTPGRSTYWDDNVKASIGIGIFTALANAVSNAVQNNRQIEANKEMAEINKQNQMELMDYQTNIAQNTNTIATQKGHAAAAGYSPALLYGNMTAPGLMDSANGSNTGDSPQLNKMPLFDRLSPNDVANNIIQSRQQQLLAMKTSSDIAYQKQAALREAAQTADLLQQTGLRKKMEGIIVDQALASLYKTDEERKNIQFMTRRGNALLAGELESQDLINKETKKKIDKLDMEIKNNPLLMAQVRSNIGYLNSMKENTQQETKNAQERLRGAAMDRIATEFGLKSFKIPPGMRILQPYDNMDISKTGWYQSHKEQLEGAAFALVQLGYSPDEAAKAVIFYCDGENKNSSGVASAFGRIISAAIVKK